jgi:acyl-CoA synthetase (AMP-forming)/AMP-acid ligase II
LLFSRQAGSRIPTGSGHRAKKAMTAPINIASHLARMAAVQPSRPALKIPRRRTRAEIDYLVLSFAELEAEVAAWADRLSAAGIRKGDRTLVMVRQGLPLIASAFGVFRLGAVPVIIDPGMGLKNFLRCVEQSQPKALLGIPLAQLVSRVFSRSFRTVRIRTTASSSLTARLAKSPAAGRAGKVPRAASAPAAETAAGDLAAILFTSGSTGAPKGVCYEHGMFDAQVRLIRETYGIEPGEVDLPMLPIFALFNPALGMTTVVPEIDPKRPAEVDPAKIVQAIQQEKVTNSFGSPTLWRKIGEHCIDRGITLPSLRRVLCAGAPVPAALWRAAPRFLPNGELHSPYGATEALPVATVRASEIDPQSVRGACVGSVVRGLKVKIIPVSDQPIGSLVETRELPVGEIGEIVVRGPVVTQAYDGRPEATAAAKIADPGGSPKWHRMGDCGYLDAEGRLWFCGRKVERVETAFGPLFTEPCEQVFRAHPRVTRCALVGLGPAGNQRPAIVVEATLKDSADCRRFGRELEALARKHAHTARIKTFYFHPKFPVDVRHNAKIHRLTLAKWAATAKGFEIEPKR